MSQFRNRLLLAGFVLVCPLFFGTEAGLADQDLKLRFDREAQTAWKQLKQKCLNSKARVLTITQENLDAANGSIVTTKSITDTGINGQNGLLRYHSRTHREQNNQLKFSEFIAGYNPKYSYIIESRDLVPRRLISTARGRDEVLKELQYRRLIFANLLLFNLDAATVFRGKTFTPVSFTDTTIQGRQLVEIKFTSNDQHHEHYRITKGTVVLDPALLWSIVEYEIVLLFADGESFIKGRNQYPPQDSWISFPIHYSLTELVPELPERPPVFEITADFTEIKTGDIQAAESTVTAFGLPEPDHVPAPSRAP